MIELVELRWFMTGISTNIKLLFLILALLLILVLQVSDRVLRQDIELLDQQIAEHRLLNQQRLADQQEMSLIQAELLKAAKQKQQN